MRPYARALLAAAVCLIGCGGIGTADFGSNVPSGAPPVIQRIDPASGSSGDTVTLFGVGFSIVASENILHIGENTIAASEYSLIEEPEPGEAEQLTFEIPPEVSAGEYNIFITVIDQPSNTNLTFTVTP